MNDMEDNKMKNRNIKRVNTIGTISQIVLTITTVATSILTVFLLVTGIFLINAPEDYITVQGSSSHVLTVHPKDYKNIHMFKIEEGRYDLSKIGFDGVFSIEKASEGDGVATYNIDTELGEATSGDITRMSAYVSFVGALIMALFTVAMVFGTRLAKRLRHCETPFEEPVIKAMKAFGISLIPWAVIKFGNNNNSVVVIIAVLIILMLISVFTYGAELQKESDETL